MTAMMLGDDDGRWRMATDDDGDEMMAMTG